MSSARLLYRLNSEAAPDQNQWRILASSQAISAEEDKQDKRGSVTAGREGI